ncbi:MAG: hypothetical protein WA359_10630 [Acidimicrobiales bacterium]
MKSTSCYQLNWSLSCSFEHLRERLPVLLEYMSSNGCEWILKISSNETPASYVEVLVTGEGGFWPVFTFDLDLADHRSLNLENSELTPILGWDWPNASALSDAYSCEVAGDLSFAISETVIHSLERVFEGDQANSFQVRLFSVRM